MWRASDPSVYKMPFCKPATVLVHIKWSSSLCLRWLIINLFESSACQILHSSFPLMSQIADTFSNMFTVTEGNHVIWFRDEVQIMILLSECCQLHASSRYWLQKSAALFPYKLNPVILYLRGHFVDVELNNSLPLSVLYMWQGYLHYKHSAIIVWGLFEKLIESFMALFQLSSLRLASFCLFSTAH